MLIWLSTLLSCIHILELWSFSTLSRVLNSSYLTDEIHTCSLRLFSLDAKVCDILKLFIIQQVQLTPSFVPGRSLATSLLLDPKNTSKYASRLRVQVLLVFHKFYKNVIRYLENRTDFGGRISLISIFYVVQCWFKRTYAVDPIYWNIVHH